MMFSAAAMQAALTVERHSGEGSERSRPARHRTGSPRLASAAISSPRRVERIAALRQTTRRPLEASRTRTELISPRAGALLADVDALRVAAAHRDDGFGHERVVHDDVRLLQDALGAKRQEIGCARSGADQPDEALRRRRRLRVRRREASRRASPVRPASAASATRPSKKLDQKRRRGWPFGSTRSAAPRKESPRLRERAEPHRQHRLDAGAELLRQHRAGAGRGDRHGDRRAVDDRRRVEVAEVGDIDGVDRDVPGPRRRDDLGVGVAIAARGEGEDRAVEILARKGRARCSIRCADEVQAARPTELPPTRRMCASVSRSRRTFAAASAPSPTTSTRRPADLVKGRKYRKPFRSHAADLPDRSAFQYGRQALGLTAKACSLCGAQRKTFDPGASCGERNFALTARGCAARSVALRASTCAAAADPPMPRLSAALQDG